MTRRMIRNCTLGKKQQLQHLIPETSLKRRQTIVKDRLDLERELRKEPDVFLRGKSEIWDLELMA